MRKAFLFVTFILYAVLSYASGDSLNLINGPWKIRDIKDGIKHLQVHFENNQIFSSCQFINIIEIENTSGSVVEIVASPVLVETSKLAKANGGICAINGSFFKFEQGVNTKDYNSVDYIRKEGKILSPNTYTGKSRSMHQRGALAIFNSKLYIIKADELKDWEKYIQAQQVITTGPVLRIGGVDEKPEQSSFYTTRHPRTAVAIKNDGTIMLFTVDGRAKESQGMTLEELQKTLRWLGAKDIINLDGGGSTSMFIDGFSDNGIVNKPSDNKIFDNKGERKVANIIMVR
ncbi:MAG: phosphodiester glycosidase family protein [Bacteroidales bacterium]